MPNDARIEELLVELDEDAEGFNAVLTARAAAAIRELQKDAKIGRSRLVVGWVRGVEFIGLPEHRKNGDRPVFTLELGE